MDCLFNLGLSISYDRVLDISTGLGNSICHFYESQKAVCPPNLRGSLFTTSAMDNIDHNPSSTTAHDSFHGTEISLFQHDFSNFSIIQRDAQAVLNCSKSENIGSLPDSYTTVPPVSACCKDPPLPRRQLPNNLIASLSLKQ